MTTVFIAEKPAQAKSYAEAFSYSRKGDGFISCKDESLIADEVIITWAIGHLVALESPKSYYPNWQDDWEVWRDLSKLPIFPESFKYTVPKDKKTHFSKVKKVLKQANTIVWAGDIDREGSLISYLICQEAGVLNKPMKRLWVTDLLPKTIQNGIRELQPIEKSMLQAKEAQARQISDWLVGMNASPLYAKTLQGIGIDANFSIGRVMTPTLFMIYQRELAIRNFKKETYCEVEADFKHSNGTYRGKSIASKKFDTQIDAEMFIASQSENEGKIVDVSIKQEKTLSPRLYKLKTIQQKMNGTRKLSAAVTLEILQSLYDKKFLSYPRTDVQYISSGNFEQLKDKLADYAAFLDFPVSEFSNLIPNKRYVDDKKVAEHYANIPTEKIPTPSEWAKLSEDEKAVYLEVLKATLAMFMPPYEYEQTTIMTQSGSIQFKTTGNVPKINGWKDLLTTNSEKSEQKLLPKVSVHDAVEANVMPVNKETKAPSKYTEATLLTAMETAGKDVDEAALAKVLATVKGIGTAATRASIIEKLKTKDANKQAYIKIINNKIELESKSFALCKAVSVEKLLSSAEMTGSWELFLEKIGTGEKNQEDFILGIKKFIASLISKVPGNLAKLDFSEEEQLLGAKVVVTTLPPCPKCQGDLKSTRKAISCLSCDFIVWGTIAKKKVPERAIIDLLEKSETGFIKGFKNKSGKSFGAYLYLKDDFTVGFDFGD